MIANYDLQRRLPTFDFYAWLAHVRMLGATEIAFSRGRKFFMRKKWPPAETERRLASILMPGPALARLPSRISDEGDHKIGSHLYVDLICTMLTLNCEMPRLRSVHRFHPQPMMPRYTVTLRNSKHRSWRNSNREVWEHFAWEIGAMVIEDWSDDPISLQERIAWYAGAKMNFGVPTGPLSILAWTDYPLCEVADPETCGDDYAKQGIAVGTQVPWFRSNQRIVWEKPSLDLLMSLVERKAA